MFKSARWRSDKNKIKSVFKLQFHATQLKQVAGDTLIVSIVPADTGKPTTKLEKSKIKDGSCYWEKPHYETVKFVLDPKTGKFHEKIYNFVLATTGSSKTSSLGEVSVDFASFTEAAKICSLSLPLKNAKCAAFLHVSIQRVQESLDQREIDASENANRHERTLRAQLSNTDGEESFRINPSEDHVALTDNRDRLGSSGSDITLLASDISSAGPETLREPEPNHEPPAATIYEEQHMSQWDWLDGSPTELSTDDSSPGETVLEEIREDSSPEAIIKKLKTELEVLARQADVTELELQTLRKQIVKERKKGLELSREVSALNEERNALKEECEKIKGTDEIKVKGDPWDLVDELRQELNYEKDLNSNLRLQLQKTQESNAELILAVQDLDAMLEQKDSDMLKLKSKCSELENVKSETDDDEDQKALEDIVRQHTGGMQEARLLEQKINDLYGEIESYKRDKDELEMQMDQMALDYEIVKQGNHDLCYKLEQSELQEQLNTRYECTSYDVVNELESLKSEVKLKSEKLSASVLAIEELESVIKNLEKDLQDQADGFEADIEDLINAKVEQEQRAIRAEESLRKMKFQNVNTAERLQEEFRRLSAQMNSSFEANEKVTTKAINEADQLRVEKRYLEDMVKKVKQDLDSLNISYEEKLVNLSGQISQKSKELELMEKQMSSYKNEIERLKEDNKNLENVNKQKGEAYERLQSEIECYYKSRYDEMKLSLMNDETEKEKLRKQVSQLKDEIKKNENALISMEKKIKEGSKVVSKTNTRSSKEVNNLKNKIELLEGQIKTKETALKSSENSFLEKEKDLQHKIKELERRQQALNESTSISQASTAEEMALLKKLNKSMEVELMEMQERYSEISLKFAEVEGERQQLVMTLRNLKNSKKC
ncbi:putative NT-type C2 domain-containing protein [Helianthus annuus]|uniref:NT-type C2 domain-containing protein n=1 Tax=Helianthus annuus TaxID=4232 RepID=A0A9K3IJ51_HELAN|nr:myosin-9-like [Helianthus annuus]KAF5797487.1 putative NT-type C2 domain-containing protein [Helianthus annuus]KAJ0549226.1 putative NT-type C2 domain-containing protein [Helianthus annuus]KAJ0555509.1 putative NT-type C2 domain-containing protein [Helianthus annuus]KAJ0562180.1 putative NT-type C2 domain-containing protein [Helianthus annuus]KAJ0730348.1 putative NT-type C2 domain-containing protein [Helianthus annuus]